MKAFRLRFSHFPSHLRRGWKPILLAALPLVLFAVVMERASWRPHTWRVPGVIFQLTFAPNSGTLAIGCHGRSSTYGQNHVSLSDVNAGTWWQRPSAHTRRIVTTPYAGSFAFSPDGRTLAAASFVGTHGIQLWDAQTGQLLGRLLKTSEGGSYLAFWPNPQTLAYWCYPGLTLRDLPGGKLRRLFAPRIELPYPHRGRPVQLPTAYAPDGTLFAQGTVTASAGYGMVGDTVLLRNLRSGKTERMIAHKPQDGHHHALNALAFAPDSMGLVTAHSHYTESSETHEISIWDVRTGRPRWKRVPENPPAGFAFSPDGQTLAFCDRTDTVQLLDARNGNLLRILRQRGEIAALAFSPDGRTLATGTSGGTVSLWRVR